MLWVVQVCNQQRLREHVRIGNAISVFTLDIRAAKSRYVKSEHEAVSVSLQMYKSPGFLKEPPKGITYFFFKHFSVFLLLKGKCCRTYLASDSGWQIKYELTVRHCSTKRQIPYLDVEQNYLQAYRGNNSSVHSPGEAPLGNCDQFGEIQYEEDGNKIEWIQWTVIKISKLEGMMYE